MRVLCVIPVRGGSKGIPRKNLREIAGKPLVAWTILQALAARDELVGEHEVRVAVSTEDQELAAIARHYGAEVPFMRPAHLAEDTTATEPVIEHAIDFYTGEGWAPDAVMLLQATSPVRLPGTLARAVRQGFIGWGYPDWPVYLAVAPGCRAHRRVRDYGAPAPPGTHTGDLPVPGERFALYHQNSRVYRAPQPFGGVSWRNH